MFGRLVELLDGHAWARDLFDAMLAEAGADDEEIAARARFCGAPRVLSRVARDLMTISKLKKRALSALAALALLSPVDGRRCTAYLLARARNVDEARGGRSARRRARARARPAGRLH